MSNRLKSIDNLDEVMKTIAIEIGDFLVKLDNKEPVCRCKYLLDGHDKHCEYIKWKTSRRTV
jgi:hypothetical protein